MSAAAEAKYRAAVPQDMRRRATTRVVKKLRGPGRTALRRMQARSGLLAAGRTPGPPDFVGIGVQRAGTSWWHSIIEAHPEVDPLGWVAKELHFFDDYWDHDPSKADIRDYEANFLRRPGHVCGEWTPRYLADPWAVPLLHRIAPDARLLVMLRDPIDRFRSGLVHAQTRLDGVTPDVVSDAIWRGCYATQLASVLDVVPREQIMVLQLEQCRLEPAVWARRTFEFLGLDPVDVGLQARRYNTGSGVAQVSPKLIETLRRFYAEELRRLDELFPGSVDTTLWPSVTGGR